MNLNEELEKEVMTCIEQRNFTLNKLSQLLRQGLDINKLYLHGGLLHIIAFFNHLTFAKFLIDNGANIELLSSGSSTALHIAVINNSHSVSQLLLQKGANINAQNHNLETALHFACIKKDLKMVKILLLFKPNLEIRDNIQRTALELVLFSKNFDIAEIFIEAGADVNSDDERGKTYLQKAINIADLDVISFLVKHGADVNKQFKDDKLTSLQKSALMKREDIVNVLISAKADINAKTLGGKTVLHLLSQVCYGKIPTKIWENLIFAGANLDAQDDFLNTPLHIAALVKNHKIMKLLIGAGANTNINNIHGLNFLDISISNQHVLGISLGFSLKFKNSLSYKTSKNAALSEVETSIVFPAHSNLTVFPESKNRDQNTK